MKTLQNYLETYLKAEGIYDIIPDHRRSAVFSNVPVVIIWIIFFWGLIAYFLITQKGQEGILLAILIPPLIFFVTMAILALLFAFRQIRSGKEISQSDVGMIGGIFMLGLPLISAVILGIYLNSWPVLLLFLLFYVVIFAIVLLLNTQSYRLHLLIELVSSFIKAFRQSIILLVSLIPLLLVVVLFSVFSQDLWATLGELSANNFILSIIWLSIPAFIFIIISRKPEALTLIGKFPTSDNLIFNAQNIDFIKDKLDNGLISDEEWETLKKQITWRSQTKLSNDVLPIIQKKILRWLTLLIALISIALVAAFFIYFFVLFNLLISPTRIADWTHTPLSILPFSVTFLGQTWNFGIFSTLEITAKVSLLLAFFVSIFCSISTFSDETTKAIITDWLKKKSASWVAISTLYTCMISYDYFIWDYIVHNTSKGIGNVIIIVRSGLSDEQIKQICENMEMRLESFKNFVMVTAFEQDENISNYRLDLPAKRWVLLHNKVKKTRKFDAISLDADPIHYQHLLGRDALVSHSHISDEWFGNSPDTILFSKKLWDADLNHEWVLHPYSNKSGELLLIDIHLYKRKSKSEEYHSFAREIFKYAREFFPNINNIMINLYFRDTTQLLAWVSWNSQLSSIEYKDETSTKIRYQKLKDW